MRKLTVLALAVAVALLALPAFAADVPATAVPAEPSAAAAQVAVQPQALPLDLAATATDATGECAAPQATLDAAGTPEPEFLSGEQCGAVVCGKFKYCCNPTCNLCLPYGLSCTLETCT
jgi:hypothetical protein